MGRQVMEGRERKGRRERDNRREVNGQCQRRGSDGTHTIDNNTVYTTSVPVAGNIS